MKHRTGWKPLLAFVILTCLTIPTAAEVKVITLPDGTTVFQLDRADMEKATFAMEQVPLLTAEKDNLITLNASTQKDKDLLTILLIAVSIIGPLLGFTAGHYLK